MRKDWTLTKKHTSKRHKNVLHGHVQDHPSPASVAARSHSKDRSIGQVSGGMGGWCNDVQLHAVCGRRMSLYMYTCIHVLYVCVAGHICRRLCVYINKPPAYKNIVCFHSRLQGCMELIKIEKDSRPFTLNG